MNLSEFCKRYGSKGKNMSSLSKPPNSPEISDSGTPNKGKSSDTLNSWAALACCKNSCTIDGKHTCQDYEFTIKEKKLEKTNAF